MITLICYEIIATQLVWTHAIFQFTQNLKFCRITNAPIQPHTACWNLKIYLKMVLLKYFDGLPLVVFVLKKSEAATEIRPALSFNEIFFSKRPLHIRFIWLWKFWCIVIFNTNTHMRSRIDRYLIAHMRIRCTSNSTEIVECMRAWVWYLFFFFLLKFRVTLIRSVRKAPPRRKKKNT